MDNALAIKRYNGNEFLKRAGQTHPYTEEEIREVAKCRQSVIAFASHFKIQTIDHGLKTIELYDFQYDVLQRMQDNRFCALNFPRQSSKTTLATIMILWDTIFAGHRNFFILANKEDTSKEVLERIKTAFMYLPEFLKPGISEWNKKRIEFDNGSKIYAATTTSDSIRGKTGSLYCDETAFIENFDDFWKSTYPVLTTGKTARSILTSTPNKMNHWYRIWKMAEMGKSNYHPITITWDTVPGRTEEWAEKVKADIGEEAFMQEYECSFLGSTGTLIPSKTLSRLVFAEPVHENDEKTYKIYKKPIEGHDYVITVDTSRGKGIDYSAFSVFDVTDYPFEQVATFYDNQINAILYPEYIKEVGEYYNTAYVLVEINDNGEEVVNRLNWDFEYDAILSPRVGTGKYQLGLRTTKKTKRIGCSNLKDLITNDKLLLNDQTTIWELANFIQKNGSFQADKGFHDDLVMTLVLFAWYITTEDFKEIRSFDFRQKVLNKKKEDIYEELVPFGEIDNGLPNEEGEYIVEDGEVWQQVF